MSLSPSSSQVQCLACHNKSEYKSGLQVWVCLQVRITADSLGLTSSQKTRVWYVRHFLIEVSSYLTECVKLHFFFWKLAVIFINVLHYCYMRLAVLQKKIIFNFSKGLITCYAALKQLLSFDRINQPLIKINFSDD